MRLCRVQGYSAGKGWGGWLGRVGGDGGNLGQENAAAAMCRRTGGRVGGRVGGRQPPVMLLLFFRSSEAWAISA